MSGIEKDAPEIYELDGDESVVVMTDEDGNEYYYNEELIISIGEKRYAILVPLEGSCDCEDDECAECAEEDDGDMDVFIARIDIDENGEEIYLDPTDEEFEQVRKEYEKLVEEDEE